MQWRNGAAAALLQGVPPPRDNAASKTPAKESRALAAKRCQAARMCGLAAGGWRDGLYQMVPPDHHGTPLRQACTTAIKVPMIGRPHAADICTSHVERSNLSMRMGMRRFTRLTNGFSKKFANLRAAVALYMFHYNFCKIHKSLRVTPAMEAGISKTLWEISDIVALIPEESPKKRGAYKKK